MVSESRACGVSAAVDHWRGGAQADLRLDPVDHIVWRRGARGQSHDRCGIELLGADVGLRLHVMHPGAVLAAGVHQLTRVVAGAAADHDHDVGLTRHLDGR
jgi:hypothetical protein